MQHIKSLDGLRGIAAYAVVLAHFSDVAKAWGGVLGGGLGQLGVMIFFSLSGFLMALICFERDINWKSIAQFYQRRFARVVPLFVFVVLFFYVIYVMHGDKPTRNLFVIYNMDTKLMLEHLTLQRGVGPMWTIPIEIMFYAIFPIFWLVYRRGGFVTLCVLMFAIIFMQEIINYKKMFSPNRTSLIATVHFFMFGFLAWKAFSLTTVKKNIKRANEVGFIFFAVLFVVFWPNILKGFYAQENLLWKDPLYFLFVPGLIYFCSVSVLANRVLGSRVLSFAGNISYSVYLWHVPVLYYVSRHLVDAKNTILFFCVSIVCITAVGMVSYYIVEKPSRKALNNVFRVRKNKSVAKAVVL